MRSGRLVAAIAGLVAGALWGYAVMLFLALVLGALGVTPYPGLLIIPLGAAVGLAVGLAHDETSRSRWMRSLAQAAGAAVVMTGLFALALWLAWPGQ